MADPFRFAVQVPGRQLAERDKIVELARLCEQLGYEELYTSDHIGNADPLLPLMVAAEATTSLRFGPLVINNELHHPVLLARGLATADRLTGGRMILGVGTGYQQSEHDATGIELRAPGDRVDRLGESLVVLRSLLVGGSASHHGRHHTIELESLGVPTVQDRLPFLIGGNGRRVVELAGRHADIFQFTGLTHGPGGAPAPGALPIDDVRRRARWLEEAAGERVTVIERSALVQQSEVGPEAEEQIAELMAAFGIERSLIDETPFLMMGSVEQLVDKIGRLRDEVGISHFVIRNPEGFAPILERLAGT